MSRVKQYLTEDERWAAVVAREPAAQNAFVYCVITTKIFCRPTCKVRLARRANVVFRDSAEEAQTAGFRACKRCRPELAVYVEPEVQTISEVCKILQNIPPNEPIPKLEELAAQAGLTKFHFHRLFKKVTGKTPKEYAESSRLAKETPLGDSRKELNDMPMSDTSIPDLRTPPLNDTTTELYDFWNISPPPSLYYSENSSTPWSEPNSEASCFTRPIVTYTFEETTFGLLLVAFNEAGNVCSLELGQSRAELVQSLEKKRPPQQFMSIELTEDVARPDISNLLEAIERPSGKVLNLDESVLF